LTFSTTRQRLYVIIGLIAVVALIAGYFAIQDRRGSSGDPEGTATANTTDLVLPSPAECTVEPRSIDNLTQLASGPIPNLTPINEVIAAATPAMSVTADPAMMNQVLGLIRQSIACRNAGDYARAFALYTDEYAQALLMGAILGSGVDAQSAIIAISTPNAQPSYLWKGVSAFGPVEMLSPTLSATLVIGQSAQAGSASIESIERFWVVNDNGTLRIAAIENLNPDMAGTPAAVASPVP
jgi:hypothetical protein